MALLLMTHYVDNFRNTAQPSEMLLNVNRIQHGESAEMLHGRLWKSTTHIRQDSHIHQAFKSIPPLVQVFKDVGKDLDTAVPD
jgi:hypothetical protein